MPADYSSTAEALSVPLMPNSEESDSPTFQPLRPPWSQPRSSLSRPRRSGSIFSVPDVTFRDRVINNAEQSYQRVSERFSNMTLLQKVGAVSASIAVMALGIGFMILTGQIFKWLEPVAGDWQDSLLAYFVFWTLTFTVSFPPLIGWSTLGTISGFIFGVWKGYVRAYICVFFYLLYLVANNIHFYSDGSYFQQQLSSDRRVRFSSLVPSSLALSTDSWKTTSDLLLLP